MKKHNFYAGPCILSQYTIKNTADAIINFADMGLSILEISHRSKQLSSSRRGCGSRERASKYPKVTQCSSSAAAQASSSLWLL